jgi:glycosyltransferase involved in cell wall biosynthesis
MRVIGSGPLEGKLAGTYPEVEFAGWKSANDMPALVRDARALVMPSRYREPFGLVRHILICDFPMVKSTTKALAFDSLKFSGRLASARRAIRTDRSVPALILL